MSGSGEHVHPSVDDPVVRALSEGVGGPMGEHAAPHRWWTALRVLLLMTAVVSVLGMVQKAPCSFAEGKDQNYTYSHLCYTDLRPLYVPRGLAEHAWPYSDDEATRARYEVMEYPVGIAYWAWGTAWLTQVANGTADSATTERRAATPVDDLYADPDVADEQTMFLLINAVGFAVLALAATWLLARTHPRRPWDAAAFALSPALLLTGLINWDLLAVACVAGALYTFARGRPVLTGVLIGLGTAAKLYPLFLLGAVLVICLRERRVRDFALATGAAIGAWLLANAPAYVSGPEQWKVFWSFNSERRADLGSLWLLIDQAGDVGFSAHTINVWSWGLFGAWCLGVLAIGLTAGRARPGIAASVPRLAQLGYLIVVGFLIVNKVYSPQYVLWLLPLAVLARPRWRDQIVWQAGEVLYFAMIWWYLGGYLNPAGGGDAGFYWLAIALRVLAELYLAAVIVRDMYRPGKDPVRDEDQALTSTRSNVVVV